MSFYTTGQVHLSLFKIKNSEVSLGDLAQFGRVSACCTAEGRWFKSSSLRVCAISSRVEQLSQNQLVGGSSPSWRLLPSGFCNFMKMSTFAGATSDWLCKSRAGNTHFVLFYLCNGNLFLITLTSEFLIKFLVSIF
jgi:hypothetical protein